MQQKLKKSRKKVSVILLIAFALTMICPVSVFAANFSDVPSNHWAIQQIERMNARGIIVGYEDGTNRPNNPVTQFEAITMATRMMGLEYDETRHEGIEIGFKYPDWTGAYSVAVLAQEAGLVDVDDFNHSAPASREWIAKLLIKTMDAEDELTSVANEELAFSDANTIGSKYMNYVKLCYDKGLIGGYTDGTFKPKNTVTRAEMSAFLCRVEDQLNSDLDNVVRGTVTGVSGVNVTIADANDETKSLYATNNSVLYSNQAKKINVADLEVGDYVYVVYKNNLLLYLEERTEGSDKEDNKKPEVKTNLTGTISSVIPAKNILIVTDDKGELQTVIVDKNTSITRQDSDIELSFDDLMPEMAVRIAVDKQDQTASLILVEKAVGGQRSGTITSIDTYNNLIVMDEKSGLVSYRMAKSIEVSIAGMLSATTSNLREGDQAVYTVSDGVMTAIAVGGNIDNYDGNATVKSIDTTNHIIAYVASSGELKAAYYNSGQAVTFQNGEKGTVNDLQIGDSVKITVDNDKVTEIVVMDRNLNDGAIKGTVYAVNESSGYIIITNANGKRETYDLADNVKATLYGSSVALSKIAKGMNVELTMQGNEVIRIKANDMVEGIVKSVSTSINSIQVTTADGTMVYDVSNDVEVHFYRTTSYRLSAVSVGDTVSMKIEDEEVTEINVTEEIEMTIDTIYTNGDWIRLRDSDGNLVTADISDTDFYLDDEYTTNVNSFYASDEVLATFVGADLIKVEAVTQVRGEVTKVNTSSDVITVKTSSGEVKTVSFTNGSYVEKNGSTYTDISRISVGDRVIVSAGSSYGKEFAVMKSKTGEVRYAIGSQIQFLPESDTTIYYLVNGYYCHRQNSTAKLEVDTTTLPRGTNITIYYLDTDEVYEVVKH